jgi:hypothetical protein
VPPPGARLDPLIERWPAGREIHVIHEAAWPPDSFSPGQDAQGRPRPPSRFAPIADAQGRTVPYLYGGQTADCAIFETVFHNVPLAAEDKFVDLAAFGGRAHGVLRPTRDLHLVDLSTDGLHRLKVDKAGLIDSPPLAYCETARWAEALHRQCPQVDGLFWMSRQRDRDAAVMLFGGRVRPVDLTGERQGGALREDHALRQRIVTLGLRVGIDVA